MKYIFYLLFFLFIYNVPFTGIPVSGSKIAVLFFCVFLIVETKKRNTYPVRSNNLTLISIVLMLILYSAFAMIINNSHDTSIIYSCILLLINHMLGAYLIVLLMQNHQKLNIENILKILIVLAVIQSIIMIIMMISNSFYEFISKLSYLASRESIKNRYGGARGYGLAASITYELGVVQSFSLLFLSYFMQKSKRYYYFISYILIVVSILVTGRTGLIGVGLSIVYMFVSGSKEERKNIRNLLGIIVAIVLLFYMINNGTGNKVITNIQAYVFESYNNYKSTGHFSTHTGTNIINMFKSMGKYSISTWIFGDGLYAGDGIYYYGDVDVGFLRHILYFGIFGCLIVALFYVYIYKSAQKYIGNEKLKLMWKLLFIYLVISHLKGDFLLGCSMGISIVLIMYFTYIEEGLMNESINSKSGVVNKYRR